MIRYDSIAPPDPAMGKPPLLADIGFVCLLLLLFLTLQPFAAQPPAQAALIMSAVQPVATDFLRQFSFTGVFLMIVGGAVLARPAALLRAIPVTMMILLGWCLLSATWADAPAVVFRRAVLVTEMTASGLLSVEVLGEELVFRRLRQILVLVLVINWISIPLLPAARHLPGELDPKLVGDWRGLYHQKNTAGAVCALTVILFLFPRARTRRLRDWLVIVAAAAFLVMTRSKTCFVLLPVAVAFGLLYRHGWKTGLDRAIVATIALLAVGAIALTLAMNTAQIAHIMSDPDAFTGRTEIWNADLAYLKNHLFFGSGFEAIFGTGGQSLLAPYLHSRSWVTDVSDSHNGYLDILVGLGAIGLGIAVVALVIAPLSRFWPLNFDPAWDGYFAILVFVLFHNFTEADFLAPDGSMWLAFLLVVGATRHSMSQLKAGAGMQSLPTPARSYPLQAR